MLKNVVKFIEENSNEYLEFLKKMSSFPFVCDYSSMVLGAYLNKLFNTDTYYVDGEYSKGDEAGETHCWLEIDDTIIDFTLVQFSSYSKEEVDIDLLKGSNIHYIIDKNKSYYYKNYTEFGFNEIPDIYKNIANDSDSFEIYLSKIYKENIESMFS